MLPLWLTIALMVAANVGSAVVFGPGRLRRAASMALAMAAVVMPFLARATPLVLSVLALGALLPIIRILDLWNDRRVHSVGLRVWFFLSPFDVRRATRVPPSLEVGRLVGAVLFLALFAACIVFQLGHVPGEGRAIDWIARWLVGAVGVYAMVDAAARWAGLGYAAIGVQIPPVHDNPILSRSLAEFWGARWNRAVHGVLEQHCFRPFARRRHAVAGVFAAFVGSAVLHAWLVLLPLRDAGMTALMAGFFLVQGLLVLLERRLGVLRWQASAGRAWTFAWMVLTTPMFVEPIVRLIAP